MSAKIRDDLESDRKRLVNELACARDERDRARADVEAIIRAWPEGTTGRVRREGGRWEAYPASGVVKWCETKAQAVKLLAGIGEGAKCESES